MLSFTLCGPAAGCKGGSIGERRFLLVATYLEQQRTVLFHAARSQFWQPFTNGLMFSTDRNEGPRPDVLSFFP
jgi:hypothetical protein